MSDADFARAGLNLSEAARVAAANDPSRVVVRHRDTALTLASLDQRADSLAGGLQLEGLARGEVVAVLAASRPEFMTALVAIARAGGVAAVVPSGTTPVELPAMTGELTPRFVLGTPEHHATGDALAARHHAAVFELPAWPRAQDRREVSLRAGDDAMVLFTSGTTGPPKAIVRSHRSVMSHGVLQVDELGLDPACVLGTVQLSHESPAQAVAGGGCFVLVDGIAPATWLAAIEHYRITHLGASPSLIQAWFSAPDVGDHDISSLRSVVSAAMPLPPELRDIVEDNGVTLTDLYGTMEAGVIALNGRVVAGKHVRVDARGELHARPASELQLGFAREYTLQGRWLATGDRATFADGRLRITGRTIDTINVAGTKVHTAQIEEVLRTHPAVTDAAVVALDDTRHGQVVAGAVVVREGAEVDIRELKDHCRSQLAHHKVPRVLSIQPQFPRTSTGKVDKPALRRQLRTKQP